MSKLNVQGKAVITLADTEGLEGVAYTLNLDDAAKKIIKDGGKTPMLTVLGVIHAMITTPEEEVSKDTVSVDDVLR